MNFNLASNSVGFYQISKLACIPITLLLETLLNRRQQILSIKMTTSLLLILLGMGLVAVTEVSFSVKGFLWAAAGVLCSSLAQIFFAPLQKDLNLDALQMLFHLSPILTLGSFATIPIFENTEELLNFKLSKRVIFDVGISCCMAVLLNTSNYLGDYLYLTIIASKLHPTPFSWKKLILFFFLIRPFTTFHFYISIRVLPCTILNSIVDINNRHITISIYYFILLRTQFYANNFPVFVFVVIAIAILFYFFHSFRLGVTTDVSSSGPLKINYYIDIRNNILRYFAKYEIDFWYDISYDRCYNIHRRKSTTKQKKT